MHHIIHDTDRDGWGSAALLLASFGPENCRIHPTGEKDIRKLLVTIQTDLGDTVWMLDIPAPPHWVGFRSPKCARFVWVDHHLAAWDSELPDGIEVHLPDDDRPMTTMTLLLQEGLATPPRAMEFVAGLCRDAGSMGWEMVFDGLSALWPEVPPMVSNELRSHLASSVTGATVPDAFQFALEKAESTRQTVQAVLKKAETRSLDNLVIIRLDDAHHIPLARYSLAAGRQQPGKAIVIVHRNQRLYCGRDSRKPGFDFISHFKARNFNPKGHSYVCTVSIPSSQINEEVDMLVDAMGAKLKDRQREYLKKVVTWAEKIQNTLQPVLNSHLGEVHFRPSSGGVAMISLEHKRPQIGRSGFRNLRRLRENFDEFYRRHCIECSPGRKTREKALQSFLIRDAYQNGRKMNSINEASKATDEVDLIFAVDEIPVPLEGTKRIVCDILAIRKLPDGGYRPVLLELKSSRMMKKLVEQVETYAELVDKHSDLFGEIFSALLGKHIRLVGSCEKWIVWPMTDEERDPRQEELANRGIRVVGYMQNGSEFSFRVGREVNQISNS